MEIKKQLKLLKLSDDVVIEQTTVEVIPSLSTGLEIATISVDGEGKHLYCPDNTNELKNLSNEISSKIFIKDTILSTEKNVNSLSIIQYNSESFYSSIVGSEAALCSDTLYIINDTFMNAFGRQLCNLTMNTSTNPNENYEGIAVTDVYVKELSNKIYSTISQISTVHASVEVIPSLSTGLEIAKINVNGDSKTIYCPNSTNVKISQTLSSGIEIATISVDNNENKLYCPDNSNELKNLSSEISSKIFIKDVKTSKEKYINTLSIVQYNSDLLYNDDDLESFASSDVLYIINDTFMNAFGRQLCNLTMNTSTNPNENYEGIAVTDTFIKELSNVIDQKLKQLSIDIINELRN